MVSRRAPPPPPQGTTGGQRRAAEALEVRGLRELPHMLGLPVHDRCVPRVSPISLCALQSSVLAGRGRVVAWDACARTFVFMRGVCVGEWWG